MRHRKAGRKLNRTPSHRRAMLRNMVTQLLDHEQMITTVAKAKELRPFAEKLITKARKDGLARHRQLVASLNGDQEMAQKLIDEIGPRYEGRPGGYTRVLKLGPRRGDNAPMALIELV